MFSPRLRLRRAEPGLTKEKRGREVGGAGLGVGIGRAGLKTEQEEEAEP